ncbi:hypothetical protein CE91St44_11430 [Oscillospiraceae bacterium]|nr:hypothetical protein CE91St44_11430 [Oscillospiraceae bacterium]
MSSEEKNLALEKAEEEIIVNLKKSGIYLLEKSISWFEDSEILEILLSVTNIQIAMELLLKTYISRTYGFENILINKIRKLRDNNHTAYLKELKRGQAKTLGFEELKTFLKNKEDTFVPVIEKGSCPCFGIEYDYLEGSFARFQSVRNAFLHLGIESSDVDIKWLSTEFFCVLIVFISLLLREIDTIENRSVDGKTYIPSVYADVGDINLWSTPMDILMRHLSQETILKLRNNRSFMDDLCDFAMDAYDSNSYVCLKCGKEALFLDVYDGFAKCISCGECFMATYADCAICNSNQTVIYDRLNIEINKNIMPGFCYQCRKHPKVYQCPTCGLTYTYSHKAIPKSFFCECCEEHFCDRSIPVFADC